LRVVDDQRVAWLGQKEIIGESTEYGRAKRRGKAEGNARNDHRHYKNEGDVGIDRALSMPIATTAAMAVNVNEAR
jgi:hypothetical protein